MRRCGCSAPARAATRGSSDIDIAILPRSELSSGFFGTAPQGVRQRGEKSVPKAQRCAIVDLRKVAARRELDLPASPQRHNVTAPPLGIPSKCGPNRFGQGVLLEGLFEQHG